jgi:membrane associated rhomboid family serine protease
MFGVTTSDDYRPVAWMGRYPVDVTTILVGTHIATLVICCILIFSGAGGVLNWLQFDSASVLHSGAVQQLITYAFVHAPSASGWWPILFAIEMYMLFMFGREVERFLGRRAFLTLYLILVLVPSLLLTGLGFWQRTGMSGSMQLHFAIFIAFATIYPNVDLFLRIPAKWVALILIALATLQLLTFRIWHELTILWASVATAFLFVELRGAGPELAWWNTLKERIRPRPKYHVVPKPRPRSGSGRTESDDVYSSIDPILDKISKFGIGSLTPSERRQLDRERERLLKKSE